MQVQCYLPFWQLLSDIRDFGSATANGLCHIMKITTAERNRDMGVVTVFFILALARMVGLKQNVCGAKSSRSGLLSATLIFMV